MVRRFNYLSLFLLCLFPMVSMAQNIKPYNGPFPTPPTNKHLLFYLQRTIDVNTLVYEINLDRHGKPVPEKPVKAYWIDYAEGGKTSPLTFAQNKFAYGIVSSSLDAGKTTFRIHLVSYKKIDMYLKPSGKGGNYQVHVTINGKACILSNIMVHISSGTYLKPVVNAIELKGNSLLNGETVNEKIVPAKQSQ